MDVVKGTKYYRAVLSYGHVGKKREVSVARHLQIEGAHQLMDVYDLVSNMPGTKSNTVRNLKEISYSEYVRGKVLEEQNFFIRSLKAAN